MILLLAWLAHAEILVGSDPLVGEEVEITVLDDLSRPLSGTPVRVVHRVGLAGERELAVGLTDSRGNVYWKPGQPGRALIRARTQEHTVHVRAETPPTNTFILLGGATLLGLALLGIAARPPRRRS